MDWMVRIVLARARGLALGGARSSFDRSYQLRPSQLDRQKGASLGVDSGYEFTKRKEEEERRRKGGGGRRGSSIVGWIRHRNVAAVTRHCHESMRLYRLRAWTVEGNTASNRVLTKSGVSARRNAAEEDGHRQAASRRGAIQATGG